MLEELKDGEIVDIIAMDGACELDADGDIIGVVQRGHHAPWALRRYMVGEHGEYDPKWPVRTYMRSMPYSLLHPDEPPCDRGPEAILWLACRRTDSGAIPVMYYDINS